MPAEPSQPIVVTHTPPPAPSSQPIVVTHTPPPAPLSQLIVVTHTPPPSPLPQPIVVTHTPPPAPLPQPIVVVPNSASQQSVKIPESSTFFPLLIFGIFFLVRALQRSLFLRFGDR
ncbi:MAG: hypothetical protein PUP91_13700 [Rhizonema sp. PD37]|nr:hypothetical protein [Rhizonema sp. PD37]